MVVSEVQLESENLACTTLWHLTQVAVAHAAIVIAGQMVVDKCTDLRMN